MSLKPAKSAESAKGTRTEMRASFAGRLRSLRLTPSAAIGLSLMSLFFLLAIFGPWIAPHSPTAQNLDRSFEGPSSTFLFGTDEQGSDLLSMLLYGARMALFISVTVVTINLCIGVTLGLFAGALGGVVELVVMRLIDILLSFPGLLLNLAIVAVVKKPGVGHLIFALTINGWVGYARVARGQVLSLREREFVEAARAMGAHPLRVMFRHLLPNIMSPILVQATLGFGSVVLIESALAFLGFGAQVPYSWGALLDQGQNYLWSTPRLALVPGIAIASVVLGANLLGDWLRDRWDPKAT